MPRRDRRDPVDPRRPPEHASASTGCHARARNPPGPPLAARHPRLHRDGAGHAGAGDRREHVDVLDPERHAAACAAVPGVRTARARLPHDSALADAAALGGQLSRPPGSEHGVRRPGRGVVDELRAGGGRPRGRARRRDDRHRRLLHRARGPARHRPGADARRRSAGTRQRGRPERRLLAAPLLERSGGRRPGRASRRPARHRRRRHAAGLRRPPALGDDRDVAADRLRCRHTGEPRRQLARHRRTIEAGYDGCRRAGEHGRGRGAARARLSWTEWRKRRCRPVAGRDRGRSDGHACCRGSRWGWRPACC